MTLVEHDLALRELLDASGGSIIVLGSPSVAGPARLDSCVRSSLQGYRQIDYVASMELLLILVSAGYGVALISAAQAETIRRPDLIIRPLSCDGAEITTFLLQRNETASPLVLRFTERALQTAKG